MGGFNFHPGFDREVEEEDDPDALTDPIYQVNLQVCNSEISKTFM